jgi:YkoP domain
MQAGVRLIDLILRKIEGIHEFSVDPDCILRIQLTKARYAVSIGTERISNGDPILALHAWNERLPILPAAGADLSWALTLRRQLVYSLRLIAKMMMNDRIYSQARAVSGTSALFSFSAHVGGMRMMQHLGFILVPSRRPLGRFGEFWENLFSWWMMWAYNQASLNSRDLLRLQRTDIWITSSEFIRRYGQANHSPNRQ